MRIGSDNGYLYALDAGTRHVVWQRGLTAPDPGSGGVIVGAAAVSVRRRTPLGVGVLAGRRLRRRELAEPVGAGIHYESVSAAGGVVWTLDSLAHLDGFDAATGQVLVRRPLSADAGTAVINNTSSGVSIAEHELFVAAGGAGYASTPGFVIAYASSGG